jgi:hypothetical protein
VHDDGWNQCSSAHEDIEMSDTPRDPNGEQDEAEPDAEPLMAGEGSAFDPPDSEPLMPGEGTSTESDVEPLTHGEASERDSDAAEMDSLSEGEGTSTEPPDRG